jgi:predicted dehydrogenase
MTLTIREGQQILKVMKSTKRIVQVGTQQRTEMEKRFAIAAAMVRDGRVGKIKHVTCSLGSADVCDPIPLAEVPKVLNWDLWLGQAPKVAYRQGKIVHPDGWGAGFPLSRTHRHYRWFYEYAGGRLTDWGAHHLDIAMWALDKLHADIGNFTIKPLYAKHPVTLVDGMPTEDDRFNTAADFQVLVTFADGVEMEIVHDAREKLGFENGIMFQGKQGRFLVNRGKLVGGPVEQLKADPLPQDALTKLYGCDVPESHMLNFMECIKTRRQPVSDVESHHRMLTVCHAVNIAMRLDRELVYDPKAEQFVGDALANTFLEREQRKGFEIKT